jgi:predicted NACHT family NTPase
VNRTQIFDTLSNLPTAAFERLLFAVKPPGGLIPGDTAPQMNRVKALLDWAEGSSGRGTGEIQDCLDNLKSDSFSSAFDFSQYLQFICQDSRNKDVRDLYTETEVLIPLEAETVKQKSPTPDTNREAEQNQQKVERFPVLEGLRKYALGEQRQHLLLAGRPGSGKSTTLKRLLLETAEAAMEKPEVIPVYVQLKGDRPITDLIIAEFRRAKVRITLEQIDEWLFNDLLLLLLDGVNEIPSKERREELNAFREDNSTVPMIFTTRDLTVSVELGIQKRLKMRPLDELQMQEFVDKYLTQRGLPNYADILLQQLKDRLREIAETPLLLKMLCDVFDPATEQIPQSKGELFRLFDSQYDKFKGLVLDGRNKAIIHAVRGLPV